MERSLYSRPGDRASDREVYRLTAVGRELCHRELSMTYLYGAQNPHHDLALADRYFSLSQQERESWQTENQSRDHLIQHIQQFRDQGEEEHARALWDKLQDGRISMPDAIYTAENGITIAYEVITSHYGISEIEAKEEAAAALGTAIEFERA